MKTSLISECFFYPCFFYPSSTVYPSRKIREDPSFLQEKLNRSADSLKELFKTCQHSMAVRLIIKFEHFVAKATAAYS